MFKIPIHFVAHISIFSTTFSLPPSKDRIEGLTEEKPLILHQISSNFSSGFQSFFESSGSPVRDLNSIIHP
jgi:hypothetical protein